MAFHLHRDGTSTTFAVAELREMARRGELPQDEYIYVDEKGEWLAAGQVPELTGAWNIEESEATVAVQLTPEMLAAMAGVDARLPSLDGAAGQEPPPPNSPTASGLIRAADRPGAIAAKAAPAVDDANDSIPTTFMQLPDQLKGVPPAPPKGAAKVILSAAVAPAEEEEASTAYMAALPADLQLKATTQARKAELTPAATPKARQTTASTQAPASTREAQTALLLAIAGGVFGADRFYLGYRGLGAVKLMALGLVLAAWLVAIPLMAQIALTAALLIGWITDIVLIATGQTTDAQGKPLKR